MLISVTQNHIRTGQRAEPFCCPLALAISEITEKKVIVGAGYVSFWRNEGTKEFPHFIFNKRIKLPEKAHAFYNSFDAKFAVEPFEFELEGI